MICVNCGKALFGKPFKLPDIVIIDYYHVDGGHHHCLPKDILPQTPPAKCHICKIIQPPHKSHCSAAGTPRYRPKPVSVPE